MTTPEFEKNETEDPKDLDVALRFFPELRNIYEEIITFGDDAIQQFKQALIEGRNPRDIQNIAEQLINEQLAKDFKKDPLLIAELRAYIRIFGRQATNDFQKFCLIAGEVFSTDDLINILKMQTRPSVEDRVLNNEDVATSRVVEKQFESPINNDDATQFLKKDPISIANVFAQETVILKSKFNDSSTSREILENSTIYKQSTSFKSKTNFLIRSAAAVALFPILIWCVWKTNQTIFNEKIGQGPLKVEPQINQSKQPVANTQPAPAITNPAPQSSALQAPKEPKREIQNQQSNQTKPKMNPQMAKDLNQIVQDQLEKCWSFYSAFANSTYRPQLRVEYAQDGTIKGTPKILNEPQNPSQKAISENAIRAANLCNPLKIPEQYQPFHDEWSVRVIRFGVD